MKYIKRSAALLCALIMLLLTVPVTASADPYDSYSYDRWGDPIPSQAGYSAERAVSGIDLGIGAFSGLADIFCDSSGYFYLVDPGGNRIVLVNNQFDRAVRVYDRFTMPDGSTTQLKKPMGIYVTDEYMYIADTDNGRVLISDFRGNVLMEITKPESAVYDQKKTFLPQRVIADKAGNVYVVLGNITTGAAMFAPDGTFTGFYGANRVQPTAEIISNYIKGLFMSEAKRARRNRSVPSGITSFDIDGDFIFTCTSSSTQTTDTVKKLNAAGKNIFAGLDTNFGDFTPMYDTSMNRLLAPAIVDIDIASDGNINCLDFTTGRIFQYDKDCGLLFITGAIADQLGGFDKVSALESWEDRLYVTDSAKNTVTIFRETDFGRAVHKASALHNAGFYEEALEPWEDVLRRDGSYTRAYAGAAAGLLRRGDYSEAMKYAKLADAQKIYDKAFEGWRLEFIRANFTAIIAVIIIIPAAVLILKRRLRHRKKAAEHIDTPDIPDGKEEQS